MAKRNRKLTSDQEKMIAVTNATGDIVYGTMIFLACGNAASNLLQKNHGFTQVAADAFVKDMIPLAIAYASAPMGVDVNDMAKLMAEMIATGADNVTEIQDITSQAQGEGQATA